MRQTIFLLIIFLICTVSLAIYRYKWQILEHSLHLDTVFDEVERTELSQKEQQRNLPLHVKLCMPVVLLILFLLEFFSYSVFFNQPNKQAPILLILMAISLPFLLVLGVHKREAKTIRCKFWLSFFVTVVTEIFAVLTLFLLIDGYYFEGVRQLRHLGNFLLTFIIFLGTAFQTQRNWLQWRCVSKIEQEETFHD